MKQRNAIAASVALNLLLVSVVWLLGLKSELPPPVVIREITNNVVEAATAPVSTRVPTSQASTPFHWSMVESDDFVAYMANLRGIACPEETIRDVIRADVNDLFARRRRELLAPLHAVLWDLMAQGEEALKEQKFEDQLESLNDEKETLLKQLLGAERGDSEPRRFYPSLAHDFLSPNKQRQMAEHMNQYARLRQELQNQQGSDAERAGNFKVLREQFEDGLKLLLTPEEYSEYKLRNSSAAHFARNLYGFEPTDEEFREISRLRLDFEEAHPPSDSKDPVKRADHEEAERVVDDQIKTFLGEARFTGFKRAQDPQFQEIARVAGRFGLPDATAVNVLEVRQAAEQKVREIQENPAWDESQRAAVLQVIRQETERAVEEALGSSGLKTYERYGGGWIVEMTRPPSEEDEAE